MLSCQVNFLELLRPVLSFTGRGIFHRGHYLDCIADPRLKYSLVQFGVAGTDTDVFVGLCLPQQCSDHLVTASINSALKILGTPLSVLWIDSGAETYNYPLNWLSYLTIAILTLIAAITFVSTVRSSSKDQRQSYWLKHFDVIGNIQTHFKPRREGLDVWEGVRAVAMMWVVIGHSLSFWLTHVDNVQNILVFGNHPVFLLVGAGILSVDTFLALGGFFLAYALLRIKQTAGGKVKTMSGKVAVFAIVQRVLRIWPAYIISMLYFYSLYLRNSSGPFWSQLQLQTDLCSSMWREVLFLSNFIDNGSGGCLSWGWYLQVDFQLFLLGLLLLYCYSSKKRVFYVLGLLLAVASSVFNFVYTQVNSITIFLDLTSHSNYVNYMHDVYVKPYGRCLPYLMGLLLGVLYMEYKNQKKNRGKQQSEESGNETAWLCGVQTQLRGSMLRRRAIEWSGLALMAFVVFIPRTIQTGHEWAQWLHSLYWLLSKPLFILGLFFTVLPSLLGLETFFTSILTSRTFSIISRISFCTYLVHLMVIFGFIYDRPYDVYFSIVDSLVVYFGLLAVSLAAGFLLTVLVEVPLGNLVRSAMAGLKKGGGQQLQSPMSSLLTTNSTLLQVKDQTQR